MEIAGPSGDQCRYDKVEIYNLMQPDPSPKVLCGNQESQSFTTVGSQADVAFITASTFFAPTYEGFWLKFKGGYEMLLFRRAMAWCKCIMKWHICLLYS